MPQAGITTTPSGGGASTPTGTGIPHVVAGVQDAAASLIVNADVNAAAAIAGTKVAPDFGAQNIVTTGYIAGGGATPSGDGFLRVPYTASGTILGDKSSTAVDRIVISKTAASTYRFGNTSFNTDLYGSGGDVRIFAHASGNIGGYIGAGGAGFNLDSAKLAFGVPITLGTTPATAGDVRLPKTNSIKFRNAANSADVTEISADGADNIVIGESSAVGYVAVRAATNIYLQLAGSDKIVVAAASIQISQPIIGTSGTSPYGVHGAVTVSVTATPQAVTAAQFALDWLEFSTTLGAIFTATFPHPASLAVGYYKTVANTSAFVMTVSTGTGTTETLAATTARRFFFDSTGVKKAGALIA